VLALLKKTLHAIAVYMRENPGTVTLVGGWIVVGLAKLGLHVTVDQLTAIIAVLLPVIAGGHLAARKARPKPSA
jgi:hypothetical protein